jgi:hypothetical protein
MLLPTFFSVAKLPLALLGRSTIVEPNSLRLTELFKLCRLFPLSLVSGELP